MQFLGKGLKKKRKKKKQEETYSPAIANGPSHDAPSVAPGTHFQWKNLCWVKPGHSEPGGAEDGGEKEHKECSCPSDVLLMLTSGFLGCFGKAAGCEHADALADVAPVERPSTPNTIKREDAKER